MDRKGKFRPADRDAQNTYHLSNIKMYVCVYVGLCPSMSTARMELHFKTMWKRPTLPSNK